MFRPEDKIGPYVLVRQLGRGAFGVVWLAERRTSITTTSFALKVAMDQEPDLVAIRQEANLWKQAGGHPNVLPIIEADIYDGYVVIVSEYAPDGSLEEWVTRSAGPSAIDKSAEIVSGVLGGLQHLHMKGIIHRDLKPANILFQGETPRLADFGIARVLKTNSYSATVAGTLAYMAPEVFDGKRSVQTDIWAVGVILYRLVSGQLPYPQADMMALLAALMSRDPAPLPENVPQPIQEIVTRALNRNPAQRYESAAEMRKALSAAGQFSIGPYRVETAPGPDRHTTVRTPIVVPVRDDLDEATIVRPQSPGRTVPRVDSNEENAFSRRMPIAISLDRVQAQAPERSTDSLAGYDRPIKPGRREDKIDKISKGVRLVVGLAALLVLSFPFTFLLVKNYIKAGSERIGVSDGSGLTPPKQPVDVSSLREAVIATVNGLATATKTRNVENCMSFYAERLDTYYSLKNVSSDKVRSDLMKAFSNYSSIDIQLTNIEITPDQSGTTTTAMFDKTFSFQGQKYYSGAVQEKLWLANEGGRWRITRLKELKVYAKNSGIVSEGNGNALTNDGDAVKPKAQVIASSRPEVNNSIVTARGAVDNISTEPLVKVSIEVLLQRGDNAHPETRRIPVTPNPLPPGQRGTFEFEYDGKRDTGFAAYTITKLFSNKTEVKFRVLACIKETAMGHIVAKLWREWPWAKRSTSNVID